MSSSSADSDVASASAKRAAESPNGSTAGGPFQPKTSSPSMSSRQTPVTPLAPLEFLQNHRRGSITDPSLHAGPSPPTFAGGPAASSISSPFRRPDSPATSFPPPPGHEPRRSFSQTRPLSPYKFGEASAQPGESPSAHLRRVLRSPSADTPDRRTPTQAMMVDSGREGGQAGAERNGSEALDRAKGSDRMDIDRNENTPQHGPDARGDGAGREMEDVDYDGRRQSVVAGTKRKISSDKGVYPAGKGDIDPQLVGADGGRELAEPAPKRRGSAIDTQRIAQLSLYDRRNSVDARAAGGGAWWNDRRDSTSSASAYTSTNANTPLTTGYTTPSSAIPGDSPHGRPPGGIATFAWPANPPPPDQAAPPAMQNEQAVHMQAPPPFDPLTSVMPPVSFAPDRRMSAPTIPPDVLPTPPATGPTRALRSRSRPPSRVRGADPSAANAAQPVPSGSTNPEDASSSARASSEKAPGSTPYSRSPELRVSHKLAERKRRKEMKELFDELRDQLPADRGMKASKWEILSKAIDFIVNLKQSHQDMGREIEMLRHELESYRSGMPPPFAGAPPHGVVYGHGPPVGVPPYPPPPPGAPHQPPQSHTHPAGPPGPPGAPPSGPPQHHPHPLPPHTAPQQPLSRPGSSQNMYPPGPGPAPPSQPPTMNGNPAGAPRTETPS
ncbi:hypothetical protein L226DRAFT_529526 [Lentinus tigrinus ALCF2SS1-7]|uniref:BHLH domain-containing protein n=1 Tax=Lentinus tigrinus ALCF2SS1-6 TaxID=1328759 RepID=A0A5C2SUI3_9APHY|nr:hypothetical protein L227DRAFT_569323 [Lentinus tigrinus ALCF2SS1-6]RPD81077.1 hypothetical protein L226DRAFT_529526 [Lentinus tigrinus ALCF2SS1-7]